MNSGASGIATKMHHPIIHSLKEKFNLTYSILLFLNNYFSIQQLPYSCTYFHMIYSRRQMR